MGDPNNPVWTTSNTTTISVADLQYYESGVWRVQAISADGCVSEISVGQSLSINEVPALPIAYNNGPVCEAETIILTAEPVPNAQYRWYNGDV